MSDPSWRPHARLMLRADGRIYYALEVPPSSSSLQRGSDVLRKCPITHHPVSGPCFSQRRVRLARCALTSSPGSSRRSLISLAIFATQAAHEASGTSFLRGGRACCSLLHQPSSRESFDTWLIRRVRPGVMLLATQQRVLNVRSVEFARDLHAQNGIASLASWFWAASGQLAARTSADEFAFKFTLGAGQLSIEKCLRPDRNFTG